MNQVLHTILLFISIFLFSEIQAQQWNLEKDKDSIKVYTRPEPGSKFNAFKGETDVRAEMPEVIALLEDVEQFDEWDEDVKEIKVLERKSGKSLKYYVIYDLPWPFQDRDLCIEAVFANDNNNDNTLLVSSSIPEAMPAHKDYIRITEYWQRWILEQKENGIIHITVEGFADPAGDIPAWIANMAITESPLNMLENMKKALQ